MEPNPDEAIHPGEEDLDWTDSSIKDKKPKGLYSKTSETARGLISTETQCALFCGGKKCKYCTAEGWKPEETVIPGIYSHWVTDNILAMARPSNLALEKYNLVDKLLDAEVKTIINLQTPGEHAECGPHKLDPSGFLYNPQKFMEKGGLLLSIDDKLYRQNRQGKMEPNPDEAIHPGEEDLDWTDSSIKDKKPKGLYSKTSETARGLISTETQCALFCGGKKCKYCTAEGWKPEETVIPGIYSHWVTDNILAMARPSNLALEKYNLVDKLLDAEVKTIINLQTPGEHAECGPHKLDPSGFLYNPQKFMEKGVFFYNFGWPDYGVASLSTILDMVKVMQFAVTEGKVAVHCHAGRGRTGVIIACYLVFTNRISGTEAIHYVREKRPHSIQTRQQMQVIGEFEKYLKPFRIVFASRAKGSYEISLQQFLNRQRHVLHGYESRRLKYIPKIIYVVCERLLELAKKGCSLRKQLETHEMKLEETFSSLSLKQKKNSPTNNVQSTSITPSSSKDSLNTLGKKKRYKKSLLATSRTRYKSISMEDLADDKFKSVLDKEQDQSSVSSSNSGLMNTLTAGSESEDDNDCIVYGNSTLDLKASASGGQVSDASHTSHTNHTSQTSRTRNEMPGTSVEVSAKCTKVSSHKVDEDVTSERVKWSIDESMTEDMSEDYVQRVSYALSEDNVDSYVRERAEEYENKLNETDSAWLSVSTEGDPHVLGMLLWDWLDQLREPILRTQDLQNLLKFTDDPLVGLQKLEKGARYTMEYLIKVISKLKPINSQTYYNVYEKLISHLTHSWVSPDVLEDTQTWAMSTRDSIKGHTEKDHWGEMNQQLAHQLFTFFFNLQRKIELQK